MAILRPITKKIRDGGFLKQDWCAANKVSPRYLCAIERGDRTCLTLGEAKRIVDLLKRDGFWVQPKKRRKSA